MSRRIQATLWRATAPGASTPREQVWTRHYAWIDTAVPRAMALALREGQAGDVVVFHSTELGFEVASLNVLAGHRVELHYSALCRSSPSLMRLMGGTPKI